jgi:acetyl esterase/lipase
MLLRYFLFIALLLGFNAAPSSGQASVKTYVNYGFAETNITYAKVGTTELKLDFYRYRRGTAQKRPTLVFFHGGGWRGGSKEAYSLRVLPWLEAGWNVANVDYRLTGTALAPEAVEDCRCALRWIISNAEKYQVNTDAIVVSGQSAGGHLALMTGMATTESSFDRNCPGAPIRVAAIVNWFGITDVGDLLTGKNKTEFATNWIGADRLSDTELVRRVSPLSYVRPDVPPIITIHGDADPLVPYAHAVRLHEQLTKSGVRNKLISIRGGDHGDFTYPESRRAYRAIMKFLKPISSGKSD